VNAFSIIPVLDLKHGKVVRARAGDRANYQPIVTPLSPTSEAADVLRGLMALAPFSTVYIADLDAITGEGNHGAVLAARRGAGYRVLDRRRVCQRRGRARGVAGGDDPRVR
jgi:uncharacterized protein related to proFAR isomerase